MPQRIQFLDEPFFSQQLSLDGSQYILDIRYNETMDSYTMDIRNLTRDLLLGGIRLVKGVALLGGLESVKATIPPGQFIVVGQSDEISRSSFYNGDVYLNYYSLEELNAIQ